MSFVWSYSNLDTFDTCPRMFYHGYILKEKEPPSKALEHGNAVHKAMEVRLRNGVPLPPQFAAFEPYAQTVLQKAEGKHLHVEQKLGISKNMKLSGFFEHHVWGRGAADVIILDQPNALLIDWKTGKVREKAEQLLTLANAFMFMAYPHIQKITACNIFLEHNKIGTPYTFKREDVPKFWQWMMPRIERVEKAIASNTFCMMPGPLCAYCPVKSCPNNRS